MRLYFPAIVKETGRGYKVTAPVNILHEVSKEYKNIELYVVNREWVREDGEPVPRTLHAKLIVAELEDNRKMILSGSVNFTSNAMRSNLTSLRNIEVGVVECGKSKFILPPATRTYIEELEYEDKKIANEPKHIFIETVVYDKGSLKILLDAKKAEIPFKIEYQDAVITEVIEQKTEVIINNFKLKRAMDVKFICKTYEFYFPITILNNDDFISDDLKLSFQINMKDIIDYLAGKYKSVSEIERVKKLRLENTTTINAGMSVYFRHNLHRYFKALGALKSGLEEPFYSEAAFKNYLFNPIGLKALINFIVEDYKTGIAAQAETFMFIVEIENVIRHLKFNEDRLEESFKIKLLKEIIEEAVSIRKKIYMKGNNSLKKRYDVLLLEYGLEVR